MRLRSIFFPTRKFYRVVFAHRALSDSLFFRYGRFARADRREPGKGGVQIRHNGPADVLRELDRLESAGYQLSNLSGENPREPSCVPMIDALPSPRLKVAREFKADHYLARGKRVCVPSENYKIWAERKRSSRQSRSVKSVLLNRRECM